jgi:epoxide hydrolase-like protein
MPWADEDSMRETNRGSHSRYDWRKVEARLNALPQFVTTIDRVAIHFIHVRSHHPNALAVIITHGWLGLNCRANQTHWSSH